MSREERLKKIDEMIDRHKYWEKYYSECNNTLAVCDCRKTVAELEYEKKQLTEGV